MIKAIFYSKFDTQEGEYSPKRLANAESILTLVNRPKSRPPSS